MKEIRNIIEPLLLWYQKNKRDLPWRQTSDPYLIWVSEIMLQQTRVESVISYYERFVKRLPTLTSLAEIDENELLKLWEGLGYYSRVKNMQKCAKILIENGMQTLPHTYEELIKLPGIGSYTAGAIASIAFQEKVSAVDGNVLRVYARICNFHKNISELKVRKEVETHMNHIMPKESGNFNQALMELGATICIPGNPRCNICPISSFCNGYQNKTMHALPVKDKKKKQKEKEYSVFLYLFENKVAIKKRPSKGLLASMFEFPNVEGQDKDQILMQYSAKQIKIAGAYKHTFTHQIWHIEGYIIHLDKSIEDYIWVTLEQLKEEYSIPSAFQYFIKDLEKENM